MHGYLPNSDVGEDVRRISRRLFYSPFFTNQSVFNDLESLFENISLGKIENVCTKNIRTDSRCTIELFFTPKLSEKELKLVEKENTNFLKTFKHFHDYLGRVDVDEAEMKLSESKLKFVMGVCKRSTFIINIEKGRPSTFPKWLYPEFWY